LTDPVEKSPVVIQVCTTCRAEGEALEPREQRAGARLFAALAAQGDAGGPALVAVECFAVCRRPCTLSFSRPGAWTYIFGDFSAEADPRDIFDAARLYGASPQGLIPWKKRPAFLKSGIVARFPPAPEEMET
jgi:predicted metal-binding protein